MATPSKLPDLASVPKPAELPKHVPAPAPLRFSFFVEGSVSVANYDAATGIVDTYEGESFAVDKMTRESRTISWLEYPAMFTIGVISRGTARSSMPASSS